MMKIRVLLLGIVAGLLLMGVATGCGLVPDQSKQEAKKKVEQKAQQAKKEVKNKLEGKAENAKQEVKKKVEAGQEVGLPHLHRLVAFKPRRLLSV
jgi:hypothetical protein